MSWKVLKFLILTFFLSLLGKSARATTYYVDYVNGSDSNNGTSKSSPWKHAPGMLGLTPSGSSTGDGCSSNCASYTPAAGDQIILKGGVVWPYTVFPFKWTWNGTSSTSLYGCQGTGCIYIGNAVGAGLPSWNSGTVTSITLARDLGGWNPASPPTISCSGGGGSGAAATASVIPAASNEPLIAGFIYHTTLTASGSGYTSAPTCTISGGGTALLAADIDRAIFDFGALQSSPPDWPVGQCSSYPNTWTPGPSIPNFVIFSGVEVRNILQQQRQSSGTCQTPWVNIGANSTGSNLYIHGRFVDCVAAGSCTTTQEFQDAAISPTAPYSEVANNIIENGDAYVLGTSASAAAGICGANQSCTFGTMGIATGTQTKELPVSIHGNKIFSDSWQIRVAGSNETTSTDPTLIYGNEGWLSMFDVNISAHINRRYSELSTTLPQPTTIISYNNVDHNHVSGSGNQQQCPSGATLYFFNEVIWGTGTSTPPYGIDMADVGGSGGCTVYLYNDTLYNPTAGYVCWNTQTASNPTTITSQNLYCIAGPSVVNPYWGSTPTNNTIQNQAGSSTAANVQVASVVDSISTANSQGYVQTNLFAPTSSTGDSVTFASGATTANLTSLCTGNLVPLCSDINGNARPATGGWQAGAYQFAGSSSPAPPAPQGLTAVVN
jgi:hypothetical protein